MSKKTRLIKNTEEIERYEDGKTVKKQDRSPKVFQRDKINFNLTIGERDDFTDKQKELISLIEDKKTKVVFIQGPAGSSKTFLSIYCGLHLLNKRFVSDIVYVRSIIESASKSLGALPGEQNSKMEPFLLPLREKMEELLPKCEVDKLNKDNRVQGIPINYLRGASINAKYVIVDEGQNLTKKELTTAITRIGEHAKFIFLADPAQADIRDSGFMDMFDLFNDETSRNNGIHCFSFTNKDVVRSGILRYICSRLDNTYEPGQEM